VAAEAAGVQLHEQHEGAEATYREGVLGEVQEADTSADKADAEPEPAAADRGRIDAVSSRLAELLRVLPDAIGSERAGQLATASSTQLAVEAVGER